ncbi:MAG: ATP-binding protein [Myxococcota bacterium]
MRLSERPHSTPRLAVVAKRDAREAWQIVAALDRRHPFLPVMVVLPGARNHRRERTVPSRVDWAADPEELGPATLRLSIRYALERATRRRLEHRLDEQHLEDLTWVVSEVSHEISNPLTTLLTNLEWVQAQVTQAAHGTTPLDLNGVLDALRDTYSGACHVSRIAEDLSRSARRRSHIGAVDLRAVLDTTRRLASKPLQHLELVMRHGPNVVVRANETRLCQVFLNLLKNAAQALEGTDQPRIEVTAQSPSHDVVVVKIQDNGPGVPAEIAKSLFNPWVSTKEGGTGLGLAVSRRFLTEMGATLKLVETSDQGTTFAVELKVVAKGKARPTLVPDPAVMHARILVVDDTLLVRRSIGRALGQHHDVTTAATVAEALDEVRQQAFDLLIVDLDLPDGSGLDLYRALPVETTPRVLFLSGEIGPQALAFLEERNIPWARKPVGIDRLRDLVVETLQSR